MDAGDDVQSDNWEGPNQEDKTKMLDIEPMTQCDLHCRIGQMHSNCRSIFPSALLVRIGRTSHKHH